MKRMFFLVILSFSITVAQEIIEKGDIYYLSNTLIVKFKSAYISQLNNLLLKKPIFFNTRITEMKQLFPNSSKLNKGNEALSRIYLLEYNSSEDPTVMAKRFSMNSEIEWVEPKYVQRVTVVPNDSIYQVGSQTNLKVIGAQNSWDITKGDSTVIIGIVDTGVQWDHPDLAANILKDRTGKVIGYDFGGLDGIPDDDPREDPSPFYNQRYHGTHVAGIASAVTNNHIGIASIGFSCKILPVKVSSGNKRDANGLPFILYGYEGIKFVADNGAKIINCSWGSYSFSRYEQEVIDYATSKGSLIIAAAGNEPKILPLYPASYKNVLSVGRSNDNDSWYWESNYGRTLDVLAPGTSIISTYPGVSPNNNFYQNMSGTSMSTPLVSGLAGLVASRFKNYTPLQIGEQIRITSDDVYSINPVRYKYLLGKGRINAFRAVSDTRAISVRADTVKFIDEGNRNGLLESGDEVSIKINFINYLSPITNVQISLRTDDNAVIITSSNFSTGPMETLATVSNESDKFKFKIQSNEQANYDVNFLLTYSAPGYSDFQWISVRINQNYDTQNINRIALTITSKGALGFNDYPSNNEGVGLVYLNRDNVLNEGAFMYGTGTDRLMDAARIKASQSTDFNTVLPFRISIPGTKADAEGVTIFNDEGAGVSRLGITTTMETYAYSKEPNDSYIILQTRLNNATQQNVSSLFAGYFFDFDISTGYFADDVVKYDFTDNFGYVYSKSGTPQNTYFGVALISSDKYGFYAIDQKNLLGDVTPNGTDGFTDSEKWFALSNGIKSTMAGPSDVSFVISGGPFSISANNYIDIAFAIAGGSNHEAVREAIKQSRIKYNEIITNMKRETSIKPAEFALYQNYPNPFNPLTVIGFQLPYAQYVTLKVYNILGEEVAMLVNEEKPAGVHEVKFDGSNLASGVYFYTIKSGEFLQSKKMILLK